MAALAGFVTAHDYERTRVLDREGQVTTATVLGVDRWVKGGPQADVRFTTSDGKEVVTSLQEFTWSPRKGTEVEVEYAARDPYYYLRDPDAAGADLRFSGRATAVFAFLALAIPLLRTPVRRLRQLADRIYEMPAPPPRPRYRTYVDRDGNTRRELR